MTAPCPGCASPGVVMHHPDCAPAPRALCVHCGRPPSMVHFAFGYATMKCRASDPAEPLDCDDERDWLADAQSDAEEAEPAERQVRCPAPHCDGGSYYAMRGWSTERVVCAWCDGEGEVPESRWHDVLTESRGRGEP